MRRRLLDNHIVRTVVSAWSWLVLGVVLITWLPLVAIVRLVTAPFDKGAYAAGWLFRKLTVVHEKLNPLWTFRTHGALPPDPRRPYVLVSNHDSFVDILLISHLPWEMKWLAKESFFRFPIVGWLMRLAGDIPVERGNAKSAVKALQQCADRLDKRVSVMIFPEGTRSDDGELGAFKDGAFRLAVDKQVPIVPLVVRGTRSALQPKDWRFGRSEADVYVLDPIDTAGLTRADVKALTARTREVIAAKLAELDRVG